AGLPTLAPPPFSDIPAITMPERRNSVSAVDTVDLASPVELAMSRALMAPRWLRMRTMRPEGVPTAPSESKDFSSGSDIICSRPSVDSNNMFILEQIMAWAPEEEHRQPKSARGRANWPKVPGGRNGRENMNVAMKAGLG